MVCRCHSGAGGRGVSGEASAGGAALGAAAGGCSTADTAGTGCVATGAGIVAAGRSAAGRSSELVVFSSTLTGGGSADGDGSTVSLWPVLLMGDSTDGWPSADANKTGSVGERFIMMNPPTAATATPATTSAGIKRLEDFALRGRLGRPPGMITLVAPRMLLSPEGCSAVAATMACVSTGRAAWTAPL